MTTADQLRESARHTDGRFGIQEHTAPETQLAAAHDPQARAEADVFANEAVTLLAYRAGEDLWEDHILAATDAYLAAHPDASAIPEDERARAAGRFLTSGVATPERVGIWLNSAYNRGLTGHSAVRLVDGRPERIMPDDVLAETYDRVCGDGTDLASALGNSEDGLLLRDLLAEAHYRGATRWTQID